MINLLNYLKELLELELEQIANSTVSIDLPTIKENVEKIQAHIGPDVELMVTAKSNGYGHGLIEPYVYLWKTAGVKKFATSMVSEAVQLREAGIDCYMMVLGGIPYKAIPAIVKYNLVANVYDKTFARLMSEYSLENNTVTKIHLKINTGLSRLGAKVGDELQELIEYVKTLEGLEIEGAYTHFADTGSEDQSFTLKQLELFEKALTQIKNNNIDLTYIHTADTGATSGHKNSHYNLVRPAALVLGYDRAPGIKNRLNLKPAITWKSHVTNIRYVEPNESVSYSSFYVPKKKSKIAVLGFGTGDGYVRSLVTENPENNAFVIINGQKAPLIALNMDQSYADVTHIQDVNIDDEVYLIGKDGDYEITSEDLGNIAGTSNSHILGNIGSRPVRIYEK